MNDSGRVQVELRLALDQLKKDVKAAAELMKTGLSGGMSGTGDGAKRAGREMDELEAKTKKVTNALKDQKKAALEAWRASIPKPVVTIAGSRTYGKAGPGAFTGPVYGGGLAGGSGGFAPPPGPAPGSGMGGLPPGFVPMPVVPGGGGGGGSGGPGGPRSNLMVLAQLGAVMAGLRATIGLVQFAFQKLLAPLRAMMAVADSARRLYARGVLSGTGTGYSAQMGTLGNILGASEDDVMQFGKAVQYLGDRVRFSSGVLTKNNPAMTELGWSIKAMQASFAALASEISTTFAPILKKLADETATSANKMTSAWSNLIRNQRAVGFAEKHGLQTVTDPKNATGPFLGFKSAGAKDSEMITGPLAEKLAKEFAKYVGSFGGEAAQSPGGSAQRMPASAWEKMGLVLGTGGADHAKATAANTARIADLMQNFLQRLESPGYTNQESLPSMP
jgi:hypothetical protein